MVMRRFSKSGNIDHTGGRFGNGVIHNCAVATVGEALGHDLWIDQDFQRFAAKAISTGNIRASFGHEGGMGSQLGVWDNPAIVGDKLTADLHFYKAAADSPLGNLIDYVATLADEDPGALGVSIVGERDQRAEDAFIAANTTMKRFRSPDPRNVKHYTHIRLSRLIAADLVDKPAANPAGLFRSKRTLVSFNRKKVPMTTTTTTTKTPATAPTREATFMQAAELDAKTRGVPIYVAMSDLAKARPDLYEQHLEAAGRLRNVEREIEERDAQRRSAALAERTAAMHAKAMARMK